MKAKMKEGQKIPEPGEYQCQHCNCRFRVDGAKLACPKCANTKLDELIPVYMENDPEEEHGSVGLDDLAEDSLNRATRTVVGFGLVFSV